MAGVLPDGRAAEVCRPIARRGEDGGAVPGVEISRKTGYKIFARYKDCGVEGLTDRSRRPYRHARQLPFQIEKAIIQLKQEHMSWGAPKIRERLRRKHS